MNFRLKSAVWEITLACCFSCKYCGSSGGIARKNELSTEECLDLCEQLVDLGCRRISMIGGEVFIRRDWKQIVGRLTELGIRVAIITNGYLFTPELIRDIKDANVESVAVSLDGPKEVHDKYRQEGSYYRAMKAIQVLSENGVNVTVISTLNSENVKCLEAFYETLAKTPILAWQLQACSPMGNAANGGIAYRFKASDVIRFVEKYKNEAPFALGIADNIGYFTKGEGTLRGNSKASFTGCRAGLSSIGIDSIGNIRGCESMYDPEFIEGNIREKSLADIWNNPEAFAYNRKFKFEDMTGSCKECEHRTRCAGGCRSYNYFVHKKLYESPLCALLEEK